MDRHRRLGFSYSLLLRYFLDDFHSTVFSALPDGEVHHQSFNR